MMPRLLTLHSAATTIMLTKHNKLLSLCMMYIESFSSCPAMSRSSGGGARRGGGGGGRSSGGGSRLRKEWDEGEEIEFTVSKEVEVFPSFEAMGLKEELLRGIFDYGT